MGSTYNQDSTYNRELSVSYKKRPALHARVHHVYAFLPVYWPVSRIGPLYPPLRNVYMICCIPCILHCFYFTSQVKRAIMPNVMMTMEREKRLRTRLIILDYGE